MIRDTGKWAYELHNKVNNKLRTQCKDDPAVINPGPDPTYQEVKEKYMSMKPVSVPGRDFLFAIAVNYPDEPEEKDMATQRTFMHKLAEVYPFENMRSKFQFLPRVCFVEGILFFTDKEVQFH
jgi:hypothetical protein